MVRGILHEHSVVLEYTMRVLDLLALLAAGLGSYFACFGDLDLPQMYKMALMISLFLGVVVFNRFSLYRAWRGTSVVNELWTTTIACLSVFIGMAAVEFVLGAGDPPVDRNWVFAWLGLSWVTLVIFRSVTRLALRFMRTRGLNRRRVALVVASDLGIRVARQLQKSPWAGFDLVGYFDDRQPERLEDLGENPVLGNISELSDFARNNRIDQIWLAFPFRAEERIKEVLHALRHCTADIRMVPDVFQFRLLNQSLSEVAGIPIVNLSACPMVGFDHALKWFEDRLLALMIVILISPLMLAVAIAIKRTSPGPVIFKQERLGWDGQPIEVWKFRTMKMHEEPNGQVLQASRDDPRLTPIGGFLRRTSLDELPQFINVLQGRMSVVGPRPHAIAHNEEYKESVNLYMLRHKVKPGITGWAQVNGYRGETNTLEKMEKRIEYDLFYIENWSLWFDLRIVLMTLFRGFVHRNAY